MSKISVPVTTNCLRCEKEIYTTEYRVSRGEGKYCSKECYDLTQSKKVKTNCSWCEKELTKKPSQIKEHNFCSLSCSSKFYGKLNNKRVVLNCKNCSKDYSVRNYQKETSNFCSKKCLSEWQSKNMSGENNPTYKERIVLVCDWCASEYDEEQYKIGKSERHFCSRKCKDKYHTNVFVQTDEYKQKMKKVMINNLENGLIGSVNSKPQLILNQLLDELNIKYDNEFSKDYYIVDNYLTEYNLMIEVMGTYWHADNRFYDEINHEPQVKSIRNDKSKKSFFKNKYNISILYLWEHDLENNIELCKHLILNYILTDGILLNYHSFNHHLTENKVELNCSLIRPYMEFEAEELNLIIDTAIKEKLSKYDSTKHIEFRCDECGEKVIQNKKHYLRSKHHFCSRSCNSIFYHKAK